MIKHYSLVHAEQVLRLLNKQVSAKKSKNIDMDLWANGREQGFHLTDHNYPNTNNSLVFAQQRNSDTIVLVTGMGRDFDITTNQPSDEIWETNRHHFNTDEEAVDFIIKFFGLKKKVSA